MTPSAHPYTAQSSFESALHEFSHRMRRYLRQAQLLFTPNTPIPSRKPSRGCGFFRHLLSITSLLSLCWLCTVWWGESWIWRASVARCQWEQWEQWPMGAKPHHVVLIADPQLVDPHTYPGRPGPLNRFTMMYTDLYLRRAYRNLDKFLRPDTTFFLGDLFDGGREWATPRSKSPDRMYGGGYGTDFWMREYDRFQAIFTDTWLKGGLVSSTEPRGRKLIASLPGNHDLGFASGIQIPVKERFEAYFGSGNRIDVVGNHTFISVDTVSLSAMDQVDPLTGSSMAGSGSSAAGSNRDLWTAAEDFLETVRSSKDRAVRRELRVFAGMHEQDYHDDDLSGFSSAIEDLKAAHHVRPTTDNNIISETRAGFPSILLSHVPLYRAPETDCGPRREQGRSIAVQSGYQYQNVLTPLISKDIVSKIGAEELVQVYSGDDHDYCEIEHAEFTGRIKETTVKSISMAMGVRRPGFVAVSLFNPVDMDAVTARQEEGGSHDQDQHAAATQNTIQNELCLLPDTLFVLSRYGLLLILTLVVLSIKAVTLQRCSWYSKDDFLTVHQKHDEEGGLHLDDAEVEQVAHRPADTAKSPTFLSSSSSSSSASHGPRPSRNHHHHLAGRHGRSSGNGGSGISYGNIPASSRASSPQSSSLHDSRDGRDQYSQSTSTSTSTSTSKPRSRSRSRSRAKAIIGVGGGGSRRGAGGGGQRGRIRISLSQHIKTISLDFVRVAVLPLGLYAWLMLRSIS